MQIVAWYNNKRVQIGQTFWSGSKVFGISEVNLYLLGKYKKLFGSVGGSVAWSSQHIWIL